VAVARRPLIGLPYRRPLIGLSTRRWPGTCLGAALPPAYSEADFDISPADYPAAVAAAGGLPVHLCRDVPVAEVIERIDGLVITGGADVDPATYGAGPDGRVGPTEPGRDRWELDLLAAAAEQARPVLGVCRGMQLLNVASGGTLIADLPVGDGHARPDGPRTGRAHSVAFEAGSLAAELYGPATEVNSLHHQGVERLGAGLVVTGRSPDGAVEAVERPGAEVLGVQWHPEALGRPDPAFVWLVAAASRR
jgi:putative glutamine amidotransferase